MCVCVLSVQGRAVDGCPASSTSCPHPPPRGADWARSDPPRPPIGRTDAGCSLWAAAPARTPPLAGWRRAAPPEGPMSQTIQHRTGPVQTKYPPPLSLRVDFEPFAYSTCVPHVWWSALHSACCTRPPESPEPGAPTAGRCHGAAWPSDGERKRLIVCGLANRGDTVTQRVCRC